MNYRQIDLPGLAQGKLDSLPLVHRILLENLGRHSVFDADAKTALRQWLVERRKDPVVPFYPHRMMMHDTTFGPAMVDLAAMKSEISEAGLDPRMINPSLRIDVTTDHSLVVDLGGTPDAFAHNMAAEQRRNEERFRFMKWAANAFDNLHVHPPGTGIMHTVNIEQLANIVVTQDFNGDTWRFPDTLIGTDSHTPMVNGLGVLAWGVGGLEAESVMLGKPVIQVLPEVVGVYLTGALQPGILSTDLALRMTHTLRNFPLNGRFVEFFGPGLKSLSVGDRCVVANMAPEFGGATGYFPIDERTLNFLRSVGRPEFLISAVEQYAREQRLWGELTVAPEYTQVIEFDLGTIEPAIAGPHRPQDLRSLSTARLFVKPGNTSGAQFRPAAPSMPIAIAAITSCTNTSDPRLVLAAGLLARKARVRGLTPAPWVKTSFAPGSVASRRYLQRSGLLEDLEALGFSIVGFGCATCIGNSGPLTPAMIEMLLQTPATPVAVLSGNRNIPGRVHHQVGNSFLVSPPHVVAFALAGDFAIDISKDSLGTSADGKPVYLRDLWPDSKEIDCVLRSAVVPQDFRAAFDEAEENSDWKRLEAPDSGIFPWDTRSNYLRRPPFVDIAARSRLGRYRAHPLLVLGDDVTTDHISPAGAIPATGDAADYLVAHGENPADLGVFSARRGNWEVMIRGVFSNPDVFNLLAPNLEAGFTVFAPSGDHLPIWRAAYLYEEVQEPVVIIAGERYGMGSSRDWAAKGTYLLGVRAVFAVSFERIHRSNLINMGILPLVLKRADGPTALGLGPGDRIEIDAMPEALVPRGVISCCITYLTGKRRQLEVFAAVETQSEIESLIQGGLISLLLRKLHDSA